jgi:hypothetical protein
LQKSDEKIKKKLNEFGKLSEEITDYVNDLEKHCQQSERGFFEQYLR